MKPESLFRTWIVFVVTAAVVVMPMLSVAGPFEGAACAGCDDEAVHVDELACCDAAPAEGEKQAAGDEVPMDRCPPCEPGDCPCECPCCYSMMRPAPMIAGLFGPVLLPDERRTVVSTPVTRPEPVALSVPVQPPIV